MAKAKRTKKPTPPPPAQPRPKSPKVEVIGPAGRVLMREDELARHSKTHRRVRATAVHEPGEPRPASHRKPVTRTAKVARGQKTKPAPRAAAPSAKPSPDPKPLASDED